MTEEEDVRIAHEIHIERAPAAVRRQFRGYHKRLKDLLEQSATTA
jgi:hypothetical protein